MSIYKKGDKTIVCLVVSEITLTLRNIVNKDERRQIIRDYLYRSVVGKTLSKTLESTILLLNCTRTDVKHLTHNEHLDTTLALTLVEELLNASTYLGEKPVDVKKEPKSPNDYYWYLKVVVEIDNNEYEYVLNIGRNKTDKHLSLYDINNYNKKSADSYRISNAGNNTLFSITNISNKDTGSKKS